VGGADSDRGGNHAVAFFRAGLPGESGGIPEPHVRLGADPLRGLLGRGAGGVGQPLPRRADAIARHRAHGAAVHGAGLRFLGHLRSGPGANPSAAHGKPGRGAAHAPVDRRVERGAGLRHRDAAHHERERRAAAADGVRAGGGLPAVAVRGGQRPHGLAAGPGRPAGGPGVAHHRGHGRGLLDGAGPRAHAARGQPAVHQHGIHGHPGHPARGQRSADVDRNGGRTAGAFRAHRGERHGHGSRPDLPARGRRVQAGLRAGRRNAPRPAAGGGRRAGGHAGARTAGRHAGRAAARAAQPGARRGRGPAGRGRGRGGRGHPRQGQAGGRALSRCAPLRPDLRRHRAGGAAVAVRPARRRARQRAPLHADREQPHLQRYSAGLAGQRHRRRQHGPHRHGLQPGGAPHNGSRAGRRRGGGRSRRCRTRCATRCAPRWRGTRA